MKVRFAVDDIVFTLKPQISYKSGNWIVTDKKTRSKGTSPIFDGALSAWAKKIEEDANSYHYPGHWCEYHNIQYNIDYLQQLVH